MYSNTGHFRNFAFDTDSVMDDIHCLNGFQSEIEEFYEDYDSDSDYFLADESLEESWDASCQFSKQFSRCGRKWKIHINPFTTRGLTASP